MRGLPVRPGQDGGWGWMVVFGAAIAQTAFGMCGRTMGVYYMLFLERYNSTATVGAIATAIPMLLWGILGPLVTMLINITSCRLVGGIGALLMVLGLISAAYVPNIIWLCCSFSILMGVGMSMTYAPCFIIVGEYFNKRKALAMAVQSTGSAVGAIIGPPMLFALVPYYSYSGTMMIVAGIAMHMFIASALYRPFSKHTRMAQLEASIANKQDEESAKTARKRRRKNPLEKPEEDPDLVIYVSIDEDSVENTNNTNQSANVDKAKKTSGTDVKQGDKDAVKQGDKDAVKQGDTGAVASELVHSEGNVPGARNEKSKEKKEEKDTNTDERSELQAIGSDLLHCEGNTDTGIKTNKSKGLDTKSSKKNTPELQTDSELETLEANHVEGSTDNKLKNPKGKKLARDTEEATESELTPLTSKSINSESDKETTLDTTVDSKEKITKPSKQTKSELKPQPKISHPDKSSRKDLKYDKLPDVKFLNTKEVHCLERDETEAERKAREAEEDKQQKKKLFDTDLLKDPAFQVILFVTFAAINAFGVNVNFLPAMAHDKGIPLLESSLLLSCIGISDCICRVPWGIMFDMRRVKRYRLVLYNTAMFIAGITIALFASTSSYPALVITALIRGSCSGLFLSQRATVLGDLIGEHRVAQAFGLQLVVTGIGTLTGRLLGGLCRDYLDSYNWAFYSSGGLVMLSCLSFYTFLFSNWDDMHREQRSTATTSSSSMSSMRSASARSLNRSVKSVRSR